MRLGQALEPGSQWRSLSLDVSDNLSWHPSYRADSSLGGASWSSHSELTPLPFPMMSLGDCARYPWPGHYPPWTPCQSPNQSPSSLLPSSHPFALYWLMKDTCTCEIIKSMHGNFICQPKIEVTVLGMKGEGRLGRGALLYEEWLSAYKRERWNKL